MCPNTRVACSCIVHNLLSSCLRIHYYSPWLTKPRHLFRESYITVWVGGLLLGMCTSVCSSKPLSIYTLSGSPAVFVFMWLSCRVHHHLLCTKCPFKTLFRVVHTCSKRVCLVNCSFRQYMQRVKVQTIHSQTRGIRLVRFEKSIIT